MNLHLVQVPDAHCASCNGTFVEKVGTLSGLSRFSWFDTVRQIEGEGDDPRSFQDPGPPFDGPTAPGGGPGVDNFFSTHQFHAWPSTI